MTSSTLMKGKGLTRRTLYNVETKKVACDMCKHLVEYKYLKRVDNGNYTKMLICSKCYHE